MIECDLLQIIKITAGNLLNCSTCVERESSVCQQKAEAAYNLKVTWTNDYQFQGDPKHENLSYMPQKL